MPIRRNKQSQIVRRLFSDEIVNRAKTRGMGIVRKQASQGRHQKRRQEGRKIYSQHAPETECIGKDKVHKPCEFDCKAFTTNSANPGGMFVLHAKTLHGNPYDGHTKITKTRHNYWL